MFEKYYFKDSVFCGRISINPFFMKMSFARKGKGAFSFLSFLFFTNIFFAGAIPVVSAKVVINEVAWAGTATSSLAEWIELYNNSDKEVSMDGWKIFDDGAVSVDLSGKKIPPRGYFLIESMESAVPDITADLLSKLSLANAGDSLELRDGEGNLIDVVNGGGGAWYAGSVKGYLTMERVDAEVGDIPSNFVSSVGTPRALNTASKIPENASTVQLILNESFVSPQQKISLSVSGKNLEEVNSYGLIINYDSSVLKVVDVKKGSFLSDNNRYESGFQWGLIDEKEGSLAVAEALLSNDAFVGGSGVFFTVDFSVIGLIGSKSNISVSGNSFVSDSDGDLPVIFSGGSIEVTNGDVPKVIDLKAAEGDERYSFSLSWKPSSVSSYMIFRKNALGEFVLIGETIDTFFIDSDLVMSAGKIIPGVEYEYSVKAVKEKFESESVVVKIKENRGIKGDNDRSDIVDGRDLQRLAAGFGKKIADEGFDPLLDTTYDGRIDGSDLIDLGASFAKKYSSK